MYNWSLVTPPKCKHCGKDKGSHRAKSLGCPVGMKTRIGYTQYSNEQFYEPIKSKNEKKTDLCNSFLDEGRIISHDPVTEDGIEYYCSQCDVKLKV